MDISKKLPMAMIICMLSINVHADGIGKESEVELNPQSYNESSQKASAMRSTLAIDSLPENPQCVSGGQPCAEEAQKEADDFKEAREKTKIRDVKYLIKPSGFTLLELLVVMVIIGLLAGIVGPRLFDEVGKSEITTARAQIDALSKALDQYRLDVGHYPSTEEGLAALSQAPAASDRWDGPYLKKAVPLDPWGQSYVYQNPGIHGPDFDLFSYGPDRKSGGDDTNSDIGNW